MTDTNDAVEALGMARQLIQEAKGADGPEGGFVTDSLDAAENWLDTVEAALSHTNTSEGVEDDLAACERAIDRMGWPEINAFMGEPGQSPYEDAGGYLLRTIKALFGIKPDKLETYREAAHRMVKEARDQGGGSLKDQRRTASPPTPDTTHNAELVGELEQEADLCRNEGAGDIAVLLDKAITALRTPDSDLLREREA
jgi:hypothetical protein